MDFAQGAKFLSVRLRLITSAGKGWRRPIADGKRVAMSRHHDLRRRRYAGAVELDFARWRNQISVSPYPIRKHRLAPQAKTTKNGQNEF